MSQTRKKRIDGKQRFVLAVLIPTVLFFVFFSCIPIIMPFISASTKWTSSIPAFVGLANYKGLIGDTHLYNSLRVTATLR